ncbi:MAG TPA: MMPL family transporter, partial [Thermoanaerobaculia bacterium]|nr:MMPL family transporter [Thermoanaerobaculia bacterium]
LRKFLPKAVLFLDQEGRAELVHRLSDQGIRERVADLRRQLAMPQAVALKSLAKLDPLGLAEIWLRRVEGQRGALAVDLQSGYFLSRDHRLLLVMAKPRRPAQDIQFTRGLVGSVEARLAALRSEWPEIAGGETPAPEVELGGGYIIALTDADLIENEAARDSLGSLGGVVVLLLFAFRRWGAVLYTMVPLIAGMLFTFAFAKLVYGELSTATAGVAAMLIGSIDFVIVSYARYVEERNAGGGIGEALRGMAGSSGWAVVVGAVTTAATFYAFCVTEFRGLRQMGVLVGTGVLFCMVAIVLLFPAMLAWGEDRHRRRDREPKLFVHGFGVRPVMSWCQRHPLVVLVGCGAITAAAAVLAPRIEFQDSMKTMRPSQTRASRIQEEIIQHFGSGFDQMMLVVSGDSAEQALELTERAAEGARGLVERGVLQGFDAVTSLVPPPRRQAEVLGWLERERAGALDPARIRATFTAAAAAEGLRVEPFAEGLDALAAALAPSGPITLADLAATEETRRLTERFIRATPDGWRSVVYLYPPPKVWKRQAPPEAWALAANLGPRVTLTGVNVMSVILRQQVRRDALVASLLGLGLVSALLWFDYRQLRAMILSLVPLAVGLVWMLGAMAAFGIDMNFMNIFVTTMIIGIGTDYGVHIVHRYREMRHAPHAEAERGIAETGKAVVLAALTTVVGFGSLSFSYYPGLRSMGIVAALGAIFTSLLSITLLPAMMVIRRRARAGEKVGWRIEQVGE